MITKFTHAMVYVLDQDQAYDFYVHKLGFEVRMDLKLEGDYRWLTVGPKEQPDLEIVLMPLASSSIDPGVITFMRKAIESGFIGGGVLETKDCRATYAELSQKGVEFLSAPEEKFYGIEAMFKDPFGTWFSLVQPPAQA